MNWDHSAGDEAETWENLSKFPKITQLIHVRTGIQKLEGQTPDCLPRELRVLSCGVLTPPPIGIGKTPTRQVEANTIIDCLIVPEGHSCANCFSGIVQEVEDSIFSMPSPHGPHLVLAMMALPNTPATPTVQARKVGLTQIAWLTQCLAQVSKLGTEPGERPQILLNSKAHVLLQLLMDSISNSR